MKRTIPRAFLPLLASRLLDVDAKELRTIYLVLRPGRKRHHHLQQLLARGQGRVPQDPLALLQKTGSTRDAIRIVREFAAANRLKVIAEKPFQNLVVLQGTQARLARAFQTELKRCEVDGKTFVSHTKALQVPAQLHRVLQAVVGMDDRPVSRLRDDLGVFPQNFAGPADLTMPTGGPPYRVADVMAAYGFPSETGKGRRLTILAFGGGFDPEVVTNYFQTALDRPGPAVVCCAVGGANNAPVNAADRDTKEVYMDLEIAGTVAPDAEITVLFAPNTGSGWKLAIDAAVADPKRLPDVISISWVGSELLWDKDTRDVIQDALGMVTRLGVTILCAAGDYGVNPEEGKVRVEFPASSPHVLACGGTLLWLNPPGSSSPIMKEEAWSEGGHPGWATGGGISAVYPVPEWQTKVGLPASLNVGAKPGRGLPDLAAIASLDSGLLFLNHDSSWSSASGTSVVAPLLAGLLLLACERRNGPLGFINDDLYQNPGLFRQILTGNNGVDNTPGYAAGPGWNACTGLGVPDATKLVQFLAELP